MNTLRTKAILIIALCLGTFTSLSGNAVPSPGDYIPGQAIVMLQEGCSFSGLNFLNQEFEVSEIELLVKGKPDKIEQQFGLDRIYFVKFSETKAVPNFVEKYSSHPHVEYAEPDYLHKLYRIPDDPTFGNQWNLWHIQAPEGWDYQIGDSTAVIAVVDGGCDWEHPDLLNNIWVNPGEDLDSDRVVWDGDDINGTDDDGNGYVDDLIGWDWTMMDNNPTPEYFVPEFTTDEDHGTWCNGIANACTDNGVGIAGLAFNCKIMAIRVTAYMDPGHISGAGAVQAINYARAKGACVISCSFGSTFPSSSENTAIQAAHAAGLVICAAAGNDAHDLDVSPAYPVCFDNVIGVAATSSSDVKASYSNWGSIPNVDVCAPGNSIYGCDPGGDYESSQGTSASCPEVAALAALLKAQYPESSNTWIENRIFASCDTIDHLNPGYAGKLGSGRINVYKALAQTVHPFFELVGNRVAGDDNADGRADPGEIASLWLTIYNERSWRDASSVQAILRTSDADITVIDSTVTFPAIMAGSTVSSIDSFSFSVAAKEPVAPHLVTFVITISAEPNNYLKEDSIFIMIGRPEILVVDDDLGAKYENYYYYVLDSFNLVYDKPDLLPREPLYELPYYDVLLWLTGDDSTTSLTDEEQDSLAVFLDDGGKLLLTGQNIGQDIGTVPFYANYLHAAYVDSNVSEWVIYGVPGDIIGDGLLFAIWGGDGAGNQISPSSISPLPGADSCMYYRYEKGACGVYYEGPYKVVYLSFGFEGMNSLDDRLEVMGKILTWLDIDISGVEEEQPLTKQPGFTVYPNPFTKEANISFTFINPGKATFQIYDLAGRLVNSFTKAVSPGRQTMSWRGDDKYGNKVSAGVYFFKLVSPEFKTNGKLIYCK